MPWIESSFGFPSEQNFPAREHIIAGMYHTLSSSFFTFQSFDSSRYKRKKHAYAAIRTYFMLPSTIEQQQHQAKTEAQQQHPHHTHSCSCEIAGQARQALLHPWLFHKFPTKTGFMDGLRKSIPCLLQDHSHACHSSHSYSVENEAATLGMGAIKNQESRIKNSKKARVVLFDFIFLIRPSHPILSYPLPILIRLLIKSKRTTA